MRAKRRHASLFALLVSMSVIATFFASSSGLLGFGRNLSIPGELTAAHSNLIDGNRCGLCHEGHKRDGLGLIAAIVEYQDLSLQCINCHEFGGQALLPHNKASKRVHDAQETLTHHPQQTEQICWDQLAQGPSDQASPTRLPDCTAALGCIGCHTEHKGADADIAVLTDQDCHQCHEATQAFDDFLGQHGKPHPPFSASYGRGTSPAINFDHAKHLDVHFEKAAYRKRRPKDCLACHEAMGDGDDVAIPSFDVGCAACHEEDLGDQPLLLLAWPELETMEPPSEQVSEACGMTVSWDPEDFDPASYEIPGLIDSFLLNIDPDDMTSYGAPYQKLARSLAMEGVQPLIDLVSNKGGDPSTLLAGLAPETVFSVACHWLANMEYEGFAQLGSQGWSAEPLALSYRPLGHTDPTLKAWLDYGLELNADMTSFALLDDLKGSLFDPETGPGRCAACHRFDADAAFQWTSSSSQETHANFTHRPHLALAKAGGGDLCKGCHQLEATAFAAGTATFAAIGVSTCQECHGKGGVSARCATCHDYHASRSVNLNH